jgi:hypothetical protein
MGCTVWTFVEEKVLKIKGLCDGFFPQPSILQDLKLYQLQYISSNNISGPVFLVKRGFFITNL